MHTPQVELWAQASPECRPQKLDILLSLIDSAAPVADDVVRGNAGSPINVVVIGGSITCGGNTYTEDQRWINQVFQWINSTWPHPEHKLRNACKPATPSMLFSFCMHQSVPDDTDLLLMEVQSSKHHHIITAELQTKSPSSQLTCVRALLKA